jgi:hypothetical protein
MNAGSIVARMSATHCFEKRNWKQIPTIGSITGRGDKICIVSVPKKLKIVRIVNGTGCNAKTGPIKGSMTRDTKHLVASRDFCDKDSTFGTRFKIVLHVLKRLNIVVGTEMTVLGLIPTGSTQFVGA